MSRGADAACLGIEVLLFADVARVRNPREGTVESVSLNAVKPAKEHERIAIRGVGPSAGRRQYNEASEESPHRSRLLRFPRLKQVSFQAGTDLPGSSFDEYAFIEY